MNKQFSVVEYADAQQVAGKEVNKYLTELSELRAQVEDLKLENVRLNGGYYEPEPAKSKIERLIRERDCARQDFEQLKVDYEELEAKYERLTEDAHARKDWGVPNHKHVGLSPYLPICEESSTVQTSSTNKPEAEPVALEHNVQRTAPEIIYLQVGDDPLDMSLCFDELMRMGDVSWCQDKVFDADIPYVRADLSQTPKTQAAVAAALIKAAGCCDGYDMIEEDDPYWNKEPESCERINAIASAVREVKQEILALPHDDSALRELIDAAVDAALRKAAECCDGKVSRSPGYGGQWEGYGVQVTGKTPDEIKAAILALPHEEIINDVLKGETK